MKKFILLPLLMSGAPFQAYADGSVPSTMTQGLSANFQSCAQKAESGIATASCLSQEKHLQDARLNKFYKALLDKVTGTQKDSLIKAERAWIDFNTKDSDFESSLYNDDQAENLQQALNDVQRLRVRADTLERYLALVSSK